MVGTVTNREVFSVRCRRSPCTIDDRSCVAIKHELLVIRRVTVLRVISVSNKVQARVSVHVGCASFRVFN